MASTFNALLCAVIATVLWGGIGLPLARRLVALPLAWTLAPICGWALHSAVMLPLSVAVGLNRLVVLAGFGIALLLALAAAGGQPAEPTGRPSAALALRPGGLILVALAAAAVALIPLWAILPKPVADGVVLAAPIYDHSKIAIVDEIIRAGVPPANPFFGENGVPGRLPYYYLWHFGAAELALALGISGWEADAGLTGFTAFAALMLAAGLAAWLSGRTAAAFWALLLWLPGSARALIEMLSPTGAPQPFLSWTPGLSGLLYQVSWAPQHVASACGVVVAVMVMVRLAQRPGLPLSLALGLLMASAFGASTWVGGILLALAAPLVAMVLTGQMPAERRAGFLWGCALAALVALALAYPLLREQYAAALLRGGSPLAVSPFEALGVLFPDGIRRVLDLPAYWAILLPVEFPAIYPVAMVGLLALWGAPALTPERRLWLFAMTALGALSLAAAWLLVSTVGNNNDFGWRAVLPALLILTVAAAAALAHWAARGWWGRVLAACCVAALGLPAGLTLAREDVRGQTNPAAHALAPQFTEAPAMWAQVRRFAGPADRVGNNPASLRAMTPWPINIGWALLSDRRSCYAGLEYATVFVPLPADMRREADQQFIRVFAGEGSADDVRDLATRYGCAVIAVTAQDGAWLRDPFAANPYYRLVSTAPNRWRIYGATIAGPDRVVER